MGLLGLKAVSILVSDNTIVIKQHIFSRDAFLGAKIYHKKVVSVRRYVMARRNVNGRGNQDGKGTDTVRAIGAMVNEGGHNSINGCYTE